MPPLTQLKEVVSLPQTRGASVLYYKIIRPYGIKQEKGLDDAINEIKKSAADTMQEVKAEAEKKEE
ncbi:hypothetical protein HDU92_005549 [Lobulomyces angularis]|nr:hypothetical protein HDU92_005549 [Lobulomyces angularis]